jgi:hypothetical protein
MNIFTKQLKRSIVTRTPQMNLCYLVNLGGREIFVENHIHISDHGSGDNIPPQGEAEIKYHIEEIQVDEVPVRRSSRQT